jgi:hypothetical protein
MISRTKQYRRVKTHTAGKRRRRPVSPIDTLTIPFNPIYFVPPDGTCHVVDAVGNFASIASRLLHTPDVDFTCIREHTNGKYTTMVWTDTNMLFTDTLEPNALCSHIKGAFLIVRVDASMTYLPIPEHDFFAVIKKIPESLTQWGGEGYRDRTNAKVRTTWYVTRILPHTDDMKYQTNQLQSNERPSMDTIHIAQGDGNPAMGINGIHQHPDVSL